MGILDQAKQWMTPERAIAMQGIGMGLSQLGAGQPVNLSPAYQALQQRQQQAQLRKVMEQPGLMDGFSPQQRAVLAAMPEDMAVEIIMQRAFAAPPDPTKGIEINGQLIDPLTGRVMGDYRSPEAAPDQVSVVTGEQAAAMGLDPSQRYEVTTTPDGALKNVSGIGAGTTNINLAQGDPQWGQAPNDHVWLRGPDGQVITEPDASGRGMVPLAVPIPGSAAARTAAEAAAKEKNAETVAGEKDASTARAGSVVLQDIARAKGKVEGAPWYSPAAGLGAEWMAEIGGTVSADVKALTSTIKANIGFDRLQQMREESPTGGALGNVTERELAMLQAVLGSLEQSQSEEQLLENLDRLEKVYTEVMRKASAYPNAAQFGFDGMSASVDDDPLGILK